MPEDRISTQFYVNLVTRRAAQEGVTIVVAKSGDDYCGIIILKINLLNGRARVLSETYIDDKIAWMPLTSEDTIDDREAESLLARQAEFDPDCWIVEVEDKQGRLWFEGKVLAEDAV